MSRWLSTAVAAVVLIAVLPLIALACLAVAAVDGRPVIYRQHRDGYHGRAFTLFKIRTMYVDADERLEALLTGDAAKREEFERYLRLCDDPRVLPFVGRCLRRWSIDELPQLVNVLAGDMRLVGPRPLPTSLTAMLPPDALALRRTVYPGLTGLWQVGGRSANDIAHMASIDGVYVRSRSLRGDVAILLRTAAAVIRGTGAY